MSAVDAVRAAHAAGIKMTVDGECLLLEANAEPPGHVLDDLSRHKQSILALLRPRQDGWTALDWQAFFDERAGVAEFDGGSPRTEAEAGVQTMRDRMAEPESGSICSSVLCNVWQERIRLPSRAAIRDRAWYPCMATRRVLACLA
jgi:hypothetical protein